MEKITVLYSPQINDNEMEIIKNTLNKDIDFIEYKRKGVFGGTMDVQIIIDCLNNPYLTAILNTAAGIQIMALLIKRIFKRNNKKIMDNETRPRYTNITLRMETKMIIISNINNENKVTISKTSANPSETKMGKAEYSYENLEKYIQNKP